MVINSVELPKCERSVRNIKIILHRIISVVHLTSFLPETWTRTNHDDESRRLALSVKPSGDGLAHVRPVPWHWGSFLAFTSECREERVVIWVVSFDFNFISLKALDEFITRNLDPVQPLSSKSVMLIRRMENDKALRLRNSAIFQDIYRFVFYCKLYTGDRLPLPTAFPKSLSILVPLLAYFTKAFRATRLALKRLLNACRFCVISR